MDCDSHRRLSRWGSLLFRRRPLEYSSVCKYLPTRFNRKRAQQLFDRKSDTIPEKSCKRYYNSRWLLSAGVLFSVLGAFGLFFQGGRRKPYTYYGVGVVVASLVSFLLYGAAFPNEIGSLAGIPGGFVYLLTVAQTKSEYVVALLGYVLPFAVLVTRAYSTTVMTAPFAEWILLLLSLAVVLSSIPSGLLLRALLPDDIV